MSNMNTDQAKGLLERFAARQKKRQAEDYRCPRCGRDCMTGHPALSRRATVGVCDFCGTAEALEDMSGERMPLEDWAICKQPEEWGLIASAETDHIRIAGHVGTWYIIDEGDFALTPDSIDGNPITIWAHLFLLEHEEYGDEAAHLIVTEDGEVALDDAWNGFDDLLDAGWEEADVRQCAICEGTFQRSDMTFTHDCHGIPFRLVCPACYERAMEKGYDGEYYTEADECLDDDYYR